MSESKNVVEMVVNYVPGEECRVAVMENGNLEEFHAERADAVSHVGNIYVGRVTNVEPSIQAAFVDFGLEANGFLHVSDVHPQYFPGEDDETTERVGKKTPRRERPPIQECFRRGDEVAVQVLKEGVGTKGPTVTSYLSIPGRFLVMMPKMDRVGVSRKVEDEEQRRQMREILDQLDLPEGFGFIVRTAGMERSKTELKRDLAYLQRLWKDMEKRWKKGNKPRLLYSESDLLVRALRDMLSGDVDRIVIDNEHALARAARFLKIVAPRSNTKLLRYKGSTPIFHAMGVEQQIRNMYAREVPLPSGGRLVIDETEALVAIDVNSGKMRDARDAETNAYRTNLEAADEICRQLRLRDLGGIVINDLIDMRSIKHRREIEAKFKDNLKKDRARTTLETISEFGILEMTRQRMRGSHESVHFADCPTCRGRGLVQKPDSVATDAMREMATLLQHTRVVRIEMVVSPRIAGELLSSKRRALTRLEKLSGKRVDVRISEAVPVDRVTFYCYDDRGADLDVTRLDASRARQEDFEECDITPAPGDDWAADLDGAQEEPEPAEVEQVAAVHDPFLDGFVDEPEEAGDTAESGDDGRKRGRRRSRRGRGGRGDDRAPHDRGQHDRGQGKRGTQERAAAVPASNASEAHSPDHAGAVPVDAPDAQGDGQEGGRRRRRRRRGRGGRRDDAGAPGAASSGAGAEGTPIMDPVLLAATGEGPKVLGPSSWDVDPGEIAGVNVVSAMEQMTQDAQEQALEGDAADVESASNASPDEAPTESDLGDPSMDPHAGPVGEGGRRRRRRRRRRGGRGGGEHPHGSSMSHAQHDAEPHASRGSEPPQSHGNSDEAHRASVTQDSHDEADAAAFIDTEHVGGHGETAPPPHSENGAPDDGSGRRRRRRRRGRGRGQDGRDGGGRGEHAGGAGHERSASHTPAPEPKPSRSSHGDRGASNSGRSDQRGGRSETRGSGSATGGGSPNSGGASSASQSSAPGAKPVRVLYSSRRKLAPSEIKKIKPE